MWIKVDNLGQSGVTRDNMAHELAPNALSKAENVTLRGGFIERMAGRFEVGPTSAFTPNFLLAFQSTTQRFAIQASPQRIELNDFVGLANVSRVAPYTGTASDKWSGGVLHGVAVLNNGVDVPQFRGDTGNFADLPNWPPTWRAAWVKPFRNYLIAGDITKAGTRFPYLVNWSHVADPGAVPDSWDIANPAKDAGDFPLSETDGPVIDALAMGDRFFIYKPNSTYEMTYVGGAQIFRFAKVSDNFGVFTRNCVVSTPVGHVLLSGGDVVLNSGQGLQSIVNGRVRDELFRSIDGDARNTCFLCVNSKRKEVFICYPEVGQTSPNKALVWNWEENTLSFQEMPGALHAAEVVLPESTSTSWSAAVGAWEDQFSAWNQGDYGDTDPRLVFALPRLQVSDQSLFFNSAPINAQFEKTGLMLDQPHTIKTITRVRPMMEGKAGTVVFFRFGGQMDTATGIQWTPEIPFVLGQDIEAQGFATGRFLAFRVRSNGADAWRMRSMEIDVAPRGRY